MHAVMLDERTVALFARLRTLSGETGNPVTAAGAPDSLRLAPFSPNYSASLSRSVATSRT
jgi:hypothetical protein